VSVLLQTCAACGTLQYPSREVCRACLSPDLAFGPVDVAGTVVAQTLLHRSLEPAMLADGPLRIGVVASGSGIRLIAHLAPDVFVGARVTLIHKDHQEQGAPMLAVPAAGAIQDVKVS